MHLSISLPSAVFVLCLSLSLSPTPASHQPVALTTGLLFPFRYEDLLFLVLLQENIKIELSGVCVCVCVCVACSRTWTGLTRILKMVHMLNNLKARRVSIMNNAVVFYSENSLAQGSSASLRLSVCWESGSKILFGSATEKRWRKGCL